jgi:hypothetical protein
VSLEKLKLSEKDIETIKGFNKLCVDEANKMNGVIIDDKPYKSLEVGNLQRRATEVQSVDKTLTERSKTHGIFLHNAFAIQSLKKSMLGNPNWEFLEDDQREALEMIAVKIGRILTGNPNEPDHWHDIVGYAKLVEDRLNESKS